jgi:hypothetical protein
VARQMMHAYVGRPATRPGSSSPLGPGQLSRPTSAGQAGQTLPAGDPERLAALVLAVAHGAVDLSLSGHLSTTGKGHANPQDLVDDLLDHLRRTG